MDGARDGEPLPRHVEARRAQQGGLQPSPSRRPAARRGADPPRTDGAQRLGRGDMLYMQGGVRIPRVHGPFVSDQEVEAVVRFLKDHGRAPVYVDEITVDEEEEGAALLGGDGEGGSGDALYDQAVALVCRERKASTSFVQRHLQIGYNRAARIIERMGSEGVVSTANHVGKREVLARNID